MRFDRDGVLGRVMRPDRDVGETEPRQQGTHAALGQMHAVSSFDDLRQIGPPPANNAVPVSYTHLTLPTIYSV